MTLPLDLFQPWAICFLLCLHHSLLSLPSQSGRGILQGKHRALPTGVFLGKDSCNIRDIKGHARLCLQPQHWRRGTEDPESSLDSQPSQNGEFPYLRKRSCLKVTRQKSIEEDSQCLALPLTCMCTGTHVHMFPHISTTLCITYTHQKVSRICISNCDKNPRDLSFHEEQNNPKSVCSLLTCLSS